MPQFNTPINTNDQSLERVLANPLPVLLVLSDNGLSAPVQTSLEQIAREEAGKLLVAKLNTRENPAAARRFGAAGGTLIVTWKGGAEQARLVNPEPEQVRAAAAHVLGHGPAPRVTQAAQRPASKASSAVTHPITVDEANFGDEVLSSPLPVLVDFWAAWCGPCRMIAPTLDKFAQEYAGKLRIAKLNVDQNPRLAQMYGAHSIPLLVLFKGGKPVQQILGAHPEPSLRKFVEQALR
jgi:thioredoxin 1